ncbi:SET and MYND domain-containing protein 4-like [Pectinophora gossypiella]|uniref:SET and MYND domain-containing protein 4-like n=1 Tax=Pectinophora gossypiella TaxID=13191 RepID=UPI00214F60AB|nr:SET and MYND domain-containing protein 4-like [Pectinophora gossypiella]
MSIDSCYENVIAKLTNQGKIKDISQKLLSLTTNGERVLYVYELLGTLKALPKVTAVHKTENVSSYYRNQGNQVFKNKDDYRALQYYNLALLHAPLKSECYCLALSNRSAVFLSLKKYKECLQDIKEIQTMEYPEKLKDKMLKRQTTCEEYFAKENEFIHESNDETTQKILKLEGPRDPRFPCASTKLEVVFSEEMGRHVIAREDIKVGEILVQEDPYFTLLLKSQFLFSCSYCLSRDLNLLPCTKCCLSLYCSEECRKKAWVEYHAVECYLMATLVQMDFTKLELLALRTVIKARNDHSDWEGLLDTIKEAERNMNNEYRGHVKVDGEWVYDSQYYPSIHTLASNIEKRSISDIFQKAVTAAVFLHFLITNTDFLKPDNKSQEEAVLNCVAGTLLLHIMTSPTNMHGLSTNIQTWDGNYIEEMSIASAPYAYHSLLNHSCAPNVVRFSKLRTGQMTLYALRPIKKGMQLFDNYGSHHALQDRQSRQEALRFQYKFTCLCEACVNNWPTYLQMTRCRNVPANILRTKDKILDADAIDELQKGDQGTALKLYKPLCELIEALEPYAPCGELADCQESVKQCLTILRGLVPYGYSKIVQWDAVPKVK